MIASSVKVDACASAAGSGVHDDDDVVPATHPATADAGRDGS